MPAQLLKPHSSGEQGKDKREFGGAFPPLRARVFPLHYDLIRPMKSVAGRLCPLAPTFHPRLDASPGGKLRRWPDDFRTLWARQTLSWRFGNTMPTAQALRGLRTRGHRHLPSDERFPDGHFVEDPFVIFR